MPRKQLQNALEALHKELEAADELGEDDRQALLAAMNEIRHALSSGSSTAPPEGPLSGRIYGLIEDLETKNPRFAEILHNVSESLANLGI